MRRFCRTVRRPPSSSQARARRDLGVDYLSTRRTAMAIRELRASLSSWTRRIPRRTSGSAKPIAAKVRPTHALRGLRGGRRNGRREQEHPGRTGCAPEPLGAFFPDGKTRGGDSRTVRRCRADPTFPSPWRPLTNCGWALLQLGRYDEARTILDRALEYFPRYGPALLNLGILETKQNHSLAAVVALEKAIASGRLSGSGPHRGEFSPGRALRFPRRARQGDRPFPRRRGDRADARVGITVAGLSRSAALSRFRRSDTSALLRSAPRGGHERAQGNVASARRRVTSGDAVRRASSRARSARTSSDSGSCAESRSRISRRRPAFHFALSSVSRRAISTASRTVSSAASCAPSPSPWDSTPIRPSHACWTSPWRGNGTATGPRSGASSCSRSWHSSPWRCSAFWVLRSGWNRLVGGPDSEPSRDIVLWSDPVHELAREYARHPKSAEAAGASSEAPVDASSASDSARFESAAPTEAGPAEGLSGERS